MQQGRLCYIDFVPLALQGKHYLTIAEFHSVRLRVVKRLAHGHMAEAPLAMCLQCLGPMTSSNHLSPVGWCYSLCFLHLQRF